MFTGIVEKIGTISSVESNATGKKLTLRTSPWESPLVIGESICLNGCCLTVISHYQEESDVFISFDLVPESLRVTTLGEVVAGEHLNVERALRLDSRLGGHQVQGHIDNIEFVMEVHPTDEYEIRLRCSMRNIDPDAVVPKGSITIDGVSLTIASVQENSFDVALIPTTLEQTTLGNAKVGNPVNIETDIIAKTIVQVVRNMQT